MKFVKRTLLYLALFLGFFSIFFFNEKGSVLKKSSSEKTQDEYQSLLLKFAVISDIHSDYKNLEKALLLIRENNNDFLIITGDLTTLGKKEELEEVKKILDKSDLRYYAIPGNHDLWASERSEIDMFGEVFNNNYKSFKEDGIKYILINNGSDYGMNEKQEQWLEDEVEECSQIYCLVFLHIPLNHPKSIYIMGEDNPEVASQAARLVKLLSEKGVREVFAGHLHASSFYTINGLTTNVIGAITGVRNFESPKYLEITVEKKGEEILLNKKEIFLYP